MEDHCPICGFSADKNNLRFCADCLRTGKLDSRFREFISISTETTSRYKIGFLKQLIYRFIFGRSNILIPATKLSEFLKENK